MWLQALGRALLRTLEGGKYSHGGFVTCRQLSAPKGYLILTRIHILAVQLPHLATSRWAPTLTWAIALGDLQHCKTRHDSKNTLALLVMQPELTLLESQQRLAQKALGLRPIARSPWCLHTASFQVSQTASSVLPLPACCCRFPFTPPLLTDMMAALHHVGVCSMQTLLFCRLCYSQGLGQVMCG